jgi:hypothetical protein
LDFAESGKLSTEQILGEQPEVEDCEGYEDETQEEEPMAMVEGSPSDAGIDTNFCGHILYGPCVPLWFTMEV